MDGSKDSNGLVGKIYTRGELEKIDADIYMDSAIIDEMAYQVKNGYIGKPESAPAGSIASESAASDVSDDELLSDYLLKIL